MAAYITKHYSPYNEVYTSTVTAGPSNLDYGGFPLNGDYMSPIADSWFYCRGDAVLSGCLVNTQPGMFAQLYNVTDGVTVGNEVELTTPGGDGYQFSTADLGITSLASGWKWYVIRIRQACSGDSWAHANVTWVVQYEKQASGTKFLTQLEVGANHTVTGTTETESSTNGKRFNTYADADFLNGDSTSGTLHSYAVLKATSTRTATGVIYSVADAGNVASLDTTSTSYTGVMGSFSSTPQDGSEWQEKLKSSVAATVAYMKCMGAMVQQTSNPTKTGNLVHMQKYALDTVISATSYAAHAPRFNGNILLADYEETPGEFIFGAYLLAGVSGTTYAQLYDKDSAVASTEVSHNTTTRTLKTLSISSPLDAANWFNVWHKRATSNGRCYNTWLYFTQASITYPTASSVNLRTLMGVGT